MTDRSNSKSGRGFSKENKKGENRPGYKRGKPSFTGKSDRTNPERKESRTGSGRRNETNPRSYSEKPPRRDNKEKDQKEYTGKNPSTPQLLRLNRYIANSGICARREADDLISGGYVTVNGTKVTQLGTKVTYKDVVKVKGKIIAPEKKVYVLLNKPKDYITTLDDPYAKKTVVQLVREACPERIYPVGRLDKNTTGVLLFTNDGDLAKKLTHPSSNVPKVYQVNLDMPITRTHLQEIAAGITLDDGPIKVDDINFIDDLDKSQIGIQIHSGRNRIVRRIFEHFGYKVKKLDRVFFAGLTKHKLPRGKWRFLSEREINRLKMNIFQ